PAAPGARLPGNEPPSGLELLRWDRLRSRRDSARALHQPIHPAMAALLGLDPAPRAPAARHGRAVVEDVPRGGGDRALIALRAAAGKMPPRDQPRGEVQRKRPALATTASNQQRRLTRLCRTVEPL